jgi:hypothetical protein
MIADSPAGETPRRPGIRLLPPDAESLRSAPIRRRRAFFGASNGVTDPSCVELGDGKRAAAVGRTG